MDKNLYQNMQNILKLKEFEKADVKHLGTIEIPVNTRKRKSYD